MHRCLRAWLTPLALATSLACTVIPAEAQAPYHVSKADLAGAPGSLIRVWPQEGGGPENSKAYRILYRSTAKDGTAIAVSGSLFFPAGPAPAGGRPVVAWAHPTSGVVEPCAPSLRPQIENTIMGLREMLQRGFVVVATDYPGLGTRGIHPYLLGASEARAVLDSVRAARALPDTDAQDHFVVWGHSQGGHAALYTGQLASSYAPELTLVGIAAAAPATNLTALFRADIATLDGKILTAMALLSWSQHFHISLDDIIAPNARTAFERTAHICLETVGEWLALEKAAQPLQKMDFLKIDPTRTKPWSAIMAHNSPGEVPQDAPLFIAQGSADTTVHPDITESFAKGLCKQRAKVAFLAMPGIDHIHAAQHSAHDAVAWMADRFANKPAPNSCER